MAEEENAAEAPAEKSGGMMKMVMFGVAALVLVAIGIFAGPAVMNMISPPEEVEVAESEDATPAVGPAIYQSLHPPIVVNFKDAYGDPHFMQVTMEVMGRDQEAINSLREHIPAIRNALILLFGQAKYEEVVTLEGKQKMLSEARSEVQRVMTETIGDPAIEEAYFTALVIQ